MDYKFVIDSYADQQSMSISNVAFKIIPTFFHEPINVAA